MNITPIYELRTRLKTAMIAGTNLILEDFRMKRVAEEIKPLEALAPVFAKIGELVRQLLAEDTTEREIVLLDTITLVDAVLCTQGQVTVKEEISPMITENWGEVITNAPYSVVKTLVEALTVSGNGHYQYVMDTHQTHPELFQDYRIKAAMIQALGAGYVELADIVEVWLKKETKSMIPMLKKGFDPKGSKEMVRRIQVMESIAPKESNEFFLQVLPEAKREIRMELLYALRNNQENVELLLQLVKKEKGTAKKMVQQALAFMEEERAKQYFLTLYQKKPDEVLQFLEHTKTSWAICLLTETLQQLLERCKTPLYGKPSNVHTEDEVELLRLALKALPGKQGEKICQIARILYEIDDIFYFSLEAKKILPWEVEEILPWKVSLDGLPYMDRNKKYRMPELVERTMEDMVQRSWAFDIGKLAEEFYTKEKCNRKSERYFGAALMAKLAEEEDCAAWLKNQLFFTKEGIRKKNIKCKDRLLRALDKLRYDKAEGGYYLCSTTWKGADKQNFVEIQPVKQDIAGAFTDVLMEYHNFEVDKVMMNFINPDNRALCEKLSKYFYERAKEVVDGRMYWPALRMCGVKTCEGLLTSYVEKYTRREEMKAWFLYAAIRELPGTADEIEKECRILYEKKEQGKIKRMGWIDGYFQQVMEQIRKQRGNE